MSVLKKIVNFLSVQFLLLIFALLGFAAAFAGLYLFGQGNLIGAAVMLVPCFGITIVLFRINKKAGSISDLFKK